MAYEIGTADNYLDLVWRLRRFLTTNADLVALGQNWTQISQAGELAGNSPAPDSPSLTPDHQIMLQGPGLAGDDQILVSLFFSTNTGADIYNVGVRGNTSYSPSLSTSQQINVSPAKYMLLVNAPMRYWFIANGRCFKAIAQAGAGYEQMYAGFILPEHLPADWPYPLFVGASSYSSFGNSAGFDTRGAFWSGNASAASGLSVSSCSSMCLPDVNWRQVANFYNRNQGITIEYIITSWSTAYKVARGRQSLSGLPVLIQGELMCRNTDIMSAYFGRFDGVFFVASFGLSPEQIVTIGGVDYLCVPNVTVTAANNYAAFALQ